MQQPERTENLPEAFARYVDLLFHSVVRQVRQASGGNPMIGLLVAISQVLALVLVFILIFAFLRVKGGGLRGDPVLFLISGIILFLLHNQAVGKTINAGSVTSSMMAHAPMTPSLNILAAAISSLYLMMLTAVVILSGLFLYRGVLEVDNPAGMVLPILLAWTSGIVIGLLFLAVKPFAPKLTKIVSSVYMRANMITSGKFFVASSIPATLLPFFTWNPLFHCIDQMRDAMFINYATDVTTITYPLYFVLGGLVIGMMLEFWLRRTVSISLGSRQG